MSIEVSHHPNRLSTISSLESIHGRNFEELRSRLSAVFNTAVREDRAPGPLRSYYMEASNRVGAVQRFQYGLYADVLNSIESIDLDYIQEKPKNSSDLYPRTENQKVLKLYQDFNCLFLHTEKMFNDCWDYFLSSDFPLNLYDSDMSVSSVFSNTRQNLVSLKVAISSIERGATTAEVIPPVPENNRSPRIYDTNANVVKSLYNLAYCFTSEFFQLYSKEEVGAGDLLRVYDVYSSLLDQFVECFCHTDLAVGREVPSFDQINPFVFFETFLTLTKHVAELRANTLVGHYIIRSLTTI